MACLPETADRPAPGDDNRWGPLRLEPGTQISEQYHQSARDRSHNWPNQQLGEWVERGSALSDAVVMALAAHYPDPPRRHVEGMDVAFQSDGSENEGRC